MDTPVDLASRRADQRLRTLASCIADCFDLIASAFHSAAGVARGFAQEA